MRPQRLLHPGAWHEAAPAVEVELAEREQRAARQEEPAGRGGLPERCLLPFGPVDPERLEQLSPRERGQRLADCALEPDAERDDAGGAVAERPLLAQRQAEREREPVLLRVHPLLVAGRVVVP